MRGLHGQRGRQRQSPNVYRMKLLGATVVPVESGSKTLKDALNEAMRDWVTNVDNTFYIIGTVAGPHPYPMMVRDFQSVIGEECLTQMPAMLAEQNWPSSPTRWSACVGGGSNAMGIFHPTSRSRSTRLIGVEAAGEGLDSGRHSAVAARQPGVLHGNRTYILQDDNGQITETHSISAGLDYPGVGPEHAWLQDIGRAEYVAHHRRRGAGRLPPPVPHRGHHPGAGVQPCLGPRDESCAKTMRPDQSILVNLGPGRQGHRHRGRPRDGRLLLPPTLPPGGAGRAAYDPQVVPTHPAAARLKAQGAARR